MVMSSWNSLHKCSGNETYYVQPLQGKFSLVCPENKSSVISAHKPLAQQIQTFLSGEALQVGVNILSEIDISFVLLYFRTIDKKN